MGVAAVTALSLLVTGCGASKPETFPVRGVVLGMVATPKDGGANFCKYYDRKVSVGDQVVIRGPGDEILGTGKLSGDDEDHYPTCILHFDIKGIPAGETAYTIAAGEYSPLIVTEEDLRQDSVGLHARGAFDVLTGWTTEMKLSQ